MVDPSAVEHGIPTPPPPPPPAEIAQAEASQVQMDFDLARETAISAAQAVQAAQEEAHAATQTASSIQQDLSDSAQAVQGEIQEEQPAAPEPAQPQPTQPASTPHQAPYQAPPPNNYQPGYYAAQQMSRDPSVYPPSYPQTYYSQPVPPPPAGYQPVTPPPAAPQPPQYKPEGLAIASMVLGIGSIALGSLVCAILALVFSSRVKSHYPNGNLGPNATYVKVGKICGAVGLGISIFVIVTVIACLIIFFTFSLSEYFNNFPYYLYN